MNEDKILSLLSATETRKEDDLYAVGPFWFIGDSLSEINAGKVELIAKVFLVDYNGKYAVRVPQSQFIHKGIWETDIGKFYVGKTYDYFPRGRVSFDAKEKKIWVNIPKGLNEQLLLPLVAKKYDFDLSEAIVKYTDPTSGNHYQFLLQ